MFNNFIKINKMYIKNYIILNYTNFKIFVKFFYKIFIIILISLIFINGRNLKFHNKDANSFFKRI